VVILGEDLVMNCPQGFQNAWFHQIMMPNLGCHTLKALGIAYHLVIKYVLVIVFCVLVLLFLMFVLCISASHIVCLLFSKGKCEARE
jgi:hypothetical protein